MKDFDKGMMAGMILIDLKSAFDTIHYSHFCKNYMLLVSRSVLLIGLYLISQTYLFWLI